MSVRGAAAGLPGWIGSFVRGLVAGVPWSECAETSEAHRFELLRGGLLRIYNPHGRTRVSGEDRSDIDVEVAKRARAESPEAARELLSRIRLAATARGGALDLDVEMPRRWNRRGTANLCLRVPRALRLEIAAVNGRVEIEGIRGPVVARSSNGSAKISDVIGDVEVTTSNAKVTCSRTCGRLVARSSNGKIELLEHRGDVDASTSNGLITASLVAVGKEGVTLATSNGRIALSLPEEVDADVDLRVDNGIVRNDRTLCHATREKDGRVVGRLGAGGPPIRLRTSNGSIALR